VFGFFSFIAFALLWSILLQWMGRFLFIWHKNVIDQLTFNEILQVYYHGFPLDFAFSSYLALFACLLYWIANMVFPQWMRRIYILIALLMLQLTVVIHLADAEMFAVWGAKFNRQALQYMQSPTEAMASSSEAGWTGIAFWWIICTFGFGWVFIKHASKMQKVAIGAKNHLVLGILSLLGIAAFGIGSRGGLGTIPINQSVAVFSLKPAANLAAVNSSWNFLYYLINKNEVIDPSAYRYGINTAQGEGLTQWYHGEAGLSGKNLCANNRPNVCLVILESFSAYASGYLTGHGNAMPFLDSLNRTGLGFTRAYASGDRTDKGLAAIIGAWPGQPWQSILHEPDKAAKLPSLANAFRQKGYQTGFIYGGDLGFANMRAYLRNAGFEQLIDEGGFAENEKTSKWGAHDAVAFEKFLGMNDAAKKPFFHTILSLSSHEPYDVPGGPYFPREDPNRAFLNSIAYTDNCIRTFMQKCATKPWFKNTLFVFVADHGRDLGLDSTQFDRQGHFHIPIVFWGPVLSKDLQGKKIDKVVSQTDIGQTICQSVLNIDKPYFPHGRNMLFDNPSSSAFYVFNSGFGVVNPKGSVVFHNQPGACTAKSGTKGFSDSLLMLGKFMQYSLIKQYLSY
jgi:phosphoglycerol transferase MdoB-like AlkP superfamily enzyme